MKYERMEKRIFLSVIIPCFNEANNLKNGCLDRVINYFQKQDYAVEIIVIDDASTDESPEILREFAQKKKIRLIEKEHSFKAGTVIRGIKEAKGEYILMSDMDQATPIEEFEKFMLALNDNVDIIIGSRKDVRTGAPLSRKIMAKGFIILRNLILGLDKIADTQCGFKLFKAEEIKKIINKLKLYSDSRIQNSVSKVTAGFDVEILYLAQKTRLRIIEIPVRWNYVETRRVSPIKDSIDGFLDMIKIKAFDIFKKYG